MMGWTARVQGFGRLHRLHRGLSTPRVGLPSPASFPCLSTAAPMAPLAYSALNLFNPPIHLTLNFVVWIECKLAEIANLNGTKVNLALPSEFPQCSPHGG